MQATAHRVEGGYRCGTYYRLPNLGVWREEGDLGVM